MTKDEAMKHMLFCAVAKRDIPPKLRKQLVDEGLAKETYHGSRCQEGYEQHVIDLTKDGLEAIRA
jgi:hypothetical protein